MVLCCTKKQLSSVRSKEEAEEPLKERRNEAVPSGRSSMPALEAKKKKKEKKKQLPTLRSKEEEESEEEKTLN